MNDFLNLIWHAPDWLIFFGYCAAVVLVFVVAS